MKEFFQLLGLEFKRFLSNRVIVAIFFMAPVFYGLLFQAVYRKAQLQDLPILVVDADQTPSSALLIDALSDNPSLKVAEVLGEVQYLKEKMLEEEFMAVVQIPQDFEADILQKRHPEVRVDLNMVNLLEANLASRNLQLVLASLNAGFEIEALKKQGMSPPQAAAAYEAFQISFHKLYNSSGSYLYYMLPGLLAAILQQVIFLAMAISFARDFEDGHFSRLAKASPFAGYSLLLKILPIAIFLPLNYALMYWGFQYFQIDFLMPLDKLLPLVIYFSLAATFIGLLFSIVLPSQLTATELLMVISTPAFVLSGFSWPRSGMPPLLAEAANYIPLTPFIEGIRKLSYYGAELSQIEPEIKQLQFLALSAFALLFVVVQIKTLLRRRKLNALPESDSTFQAEFLKN